jgi:hypothetical protein
MTSITASCSSLAIQGQQDIHDDLSTSSWSTADYGERWDPVEVSDDRPGIPSRMASNHALAIQDSQSTILSQDSLTSITFTAEDLLDDDDGPRKAVMRSVSSDALPQMPRRRASGQHLVSTSQAQRPIRTISPKRPNSGRQFGPPSIPRRQASGKDKGTLATSLSLPMRPKRYPSFKNCVRPAA